MDKATAGWLATEIKYPLICSVLGLPWWALLVGALVLVAGVVLWLRRLGQAPVPTRQPRAQPEPVGPPSRLPAAGQEQGQLLATDPIAAEAPDPALVTQLLTALRAKETRATATNSLVALGEGALRILKKSLLLETDEQQAGRLAQLCTRPDSPAARQVLVAVVQSHNLLGRGAALRALSGFSAEPADAPLFQRVVEEEMRLAQQLLHGMVEANPELRNALHYELRRNLQRLLGLLLQLYERQPVLDVQRSVTHFANERQASYWQALEHLIPRPLYRGLYALLGESRVRHRAQVFDDLLGPLVVTESVQTLVVRRGTQAFSAWTINVALRQWHPQPATVASLYAHVLAPEPLVREGAWEVLRRLPVQRPAAYDQFISDYPDVADLLAASAGPAADGVSTRQQLLLLKATPLFSATPENVLADIVPIMKEVSFQPEQEIFAKGALGTSLYVIENGEVDIFNGSQQLASFGKGDFFGELALLDAEPRSATAVARTPTVAFRLDQDEFYEVMKTRPEVLHNIMKVLCQRLRRQNEKSQVAVSH